MSKTLNMLRYLGPLAVVLGLAAGLASCGGGGGTAAVSSLGVDSFGNPIDTQALAAFTIDGSGGGGFGGSDSGADGSAGEGPPIANGTVIITDSAGKTATAVTNAAGYYRAKVTGFTSPMVVRVVGQNGKTYVSMYTNTVKTGFANTINITSFTDRMASNIAVSNGVQSAVQLTPAMVTAAGVANEQAAMRQTLAPALTAAGVSATLDFISTPFVPNGLGVDKVLDQVRHEITADGSTQLYTKQPITNSSGQVVSLPLNPANTLPAGTTTDLGLRQAGQFAEYFERVCSAACRAR